MKLFKLVFFISLLILQLTFATSDVFASHCETSVGPGSGDRCGPRPNYCQPTDPNDPHKGSVFKDVAGKDEHRDTGEPCDPTTFGRTQGGAIDEVFGRVVPPEQVENIGFGGVGIGRLLSNIITIIYVFAAIIFLFMIIFGALQWLVSGGDKEAIAKARGRIVHAIIGIVLLALAFVLVGLIGQITGFTIFEGQGAVESQNSSNSAPDTTDEVTD